MRLAIFGDLKLAMAGGAENGAGSETVVSLFGDVKIVVPPGARVTTSGFALFGDSNVAVEGGDAPDLCVNFFSLFGDLMIVEGKVQTLPATLNRAEQPTFPY